MPTDHEMTLKAEPILQALNDLRWYVQRHGELLAMIATKDRLIASLERQSDLDDMVIDKQKEAIDGLTTRCEQHERQAARWRDDAELLELVVESWRFGGVSPVKYNRIACLVNERIADGLAHNSNVD